jgi:mono/diheme cytochrome c family protein
MTATKSLTTLTAKTYIAFVLFVVLFAGCSKPVFSPNRLATAAFLQSHDDPSIEEIALSANELTDQLFGTPDAPSWPESLESVVDFEEVKRSAGPVGRAQDRVERGLYRKHCVQCHGITGDGAGPAATLLAPYARDFRRGTFKFKSTPIGSKPTKADLVHTIEHGVAGTSMPAFAPLRNRDEFSKDIEAVTEYVIYLSIRGEVERRLIRAATVDESQLTIQDAYQQAALVVDTWKQAEQKVQVVPSIPVVDEESLAASVARGKELFNSDKTACFKCHGTEGRGDGISQDYDEWTKDWTIRAGIDPASKSEWKVMKKYGALKPVVNRSRNLHLGAIRGGHSVETIAKRIVLGIDGTPMPSAAIGEESPHSLNREELNDLVRFVASIANVNLVADIEQSQKNSDRTSVALHAGGHDER